MGKMFWANKKAKELYREKYGREPKSYKEFVEANKLYAEAKKAGKVIEPRTHKIAKVIITIIALFFIVLLAQHAYVHWDDFGIIKTVELKEHGTVYKLTDYYGTYTFPYGATLWAEHNGSFHKVGTIIGMQYSLSWKDYYYVIYDDVDQEASPLLATTANKWWWSSLEPVCLTPEQVFENAWAGYPKYVLETTL